MQLIRMKCTWLLGILSALVVGCGGGTTSNDQSQFDKEKDLISNFLYLNDQDLAFMGKNSVENAILTQDYKGTDDRAYRFNGVDSAIEIPHDESFNIQKQITLTAWVYASEKRSAIILRKGADINGDERSPFELAIAATGRALFSLNLPDSSGEMKWIQLDSNYPTDEWFHMAGTYNGTEMKLYINGNLMNARDITGELSTNQSPLLIGTRLKIASSTLKGNIADVHIYSRALSSDEIIAFVTE